MRPGGRIVLVRREVLKDRTSVSSVAQLCRLCYLNVALCWHAGVQLREKQRRQKEEKKRAEYNKNLERVMRQASKKSIIIAKDGS